MGTGAIRTWLPRALLAFGALPSWAIQSDAPPHRIGWASPAADPDTGNIYALSGGAQVIAPGWIEASLTRRTVSPFSGLGYGYGWFLSDSGFAIARGYGGQIIAAHPARKLAVAITSDPGQPARSEGYFGDLMALLEGPVLALA